MRKILILSGPNLGRLGKREPEIYGTMSYRDFCRELKEFGKKLGLKLRFKQTDCEVRLMHYLYDASDAGVPVLLNAGAFTHYSYALRDCVAAMEVPVYELHLTDITKREDFRRISVFEDVRAGLYMGKGIDSYKECLQDIEKNLAK